MGGGFSQSRGPESPPDSSIPRNSDNSESSSSGMSSPEAKRVESSPETKTLETPVPASDSSIDEKSSESKNVKEGENDVEAQEGAREGEEEEGECGFCLFMKAGGCRDSFVDWENCIDEAERSKEDIVDKCFEVTGALKKCMEAHADYYGPILRAEKAAEEEVKKELEKEKKEEGEVADKEAKKPFDSQDSGNQ
ncbi:hypothetical protein HS088_TW15G00756 [Tripterygium wilfordii]|uniref:GCK domain-containing protein n=1 Tax=Tripterygium wilfordii TaxID=458696 RepID=A0A7J7CME4_TRIWF|nr:uncharacterized protein LOC120017017 [Tripterygium wilfordii]KAF5735255.1 hypothetical protein HS088_TW15G00756 [Tripterygium wilfordii]